MNVSEIARCIASAAPIAFAWVWTWMHLSTEWSTHPHYEYGWGVPVLGLLLVWRRWPGPLQPVESRILAGLFFAVGVGVFSLGELVRRNDPTWRMTGALLVAGCTLLTCAWMLRAGGWTLLLRQAGPLVFLWTCLPWPIPVESGTTQHLLHFVTSTVMVGTTMFGIPAFQRGNVIELATGTVGVDEACSGIQSFQSAFMVALFLGEFYQMTVARRVVMLVGGAAIAIVGNVLRVGALVTVTAQATPERMEEFHDLIGTVATLLIFLLIIGLAKLLATDAPFAEGRRLRPVSPTIFEGVGVAAALSVSFALITGLYAWSGNSDKQGASTPSWTLNPSKLPESWGSERFEPRPHESAALRFTSSETLKFRTPEGREITAYHFFWSSENGIPPLAFHHTPAMCMPWAGWTETGKPIYTSLNLAEEVLPAVVYSFRQESRWVSAIQIIAASGKAQHFNAPSAASANRFQRMFTAWRSPREKIDEELLLYFPSVNSEAALKEAERVLSYALERKRQF